MRITKFERGEGGYLTARVTLQEGGPTTPVHEKYGSWMQGDHGKKDGLREIPRDVAAELVARQRSLEKAERNAKVTA